MSYKFEVEGGKTVRFPVGGKYCDRDIEVTALGGGDDGYDQSFADSFVNNTIVEIKLSDSVTSIPEYKFYNASKLARIKADGLVTINRSAFYGTGIIEVVFPNLDNFGTTAFQNCKSLTKVDAGKVTAIRASAFYSCSNLETLILRNPNAVSTCENTSVFAATKISNKKGYIYVPDSLVEDYKAATNWSTFASQIKPLSELEGEA